MPAEDVLIVGAGIGGLTLGLMLARAGIARRICEAAPEINGAGQAILDARARRLPRLRLRPGAALEAYEARRREATAEVMRTNRATPPDLILGEVARRTGDRPFRGIEEVISRDELLAITDAYKRVAGYEKEKLRQ